MNLSIEPLRKGDTIAIVAPAKAIEEEFVIFAKQKMESLGYNVIVGKNTLGRHHYYSGTIPERLSDFQEALDNPEVKAILCARGGFGCVQLVDLINWSSILRNPKWIIGFSDITVFSFHPVKIITSGEGGMCTTNSQEIANLLCRFRSHGITRHENEMTKKSDGPWYYQQVELGYNYRMTDIQAALGLSQMKRIDDFVKARHAIFERYNELLNEDWLELPWQHDDTYSALHLYIVRIKKNNKGITHRQLFEKLRNAGVLVNLHYIPVYRHPYYEIKEYDINAFPNAEAYYSQAISLPIFPSLTESEQLFVIDTIKKPLGHQNLF